MKKTLDAILLEKDVNDNFEVVRHKGRYKVIEKPKRQKRFIGQCIYILQGKTPKCNNWIPQGTMPKKVE